MTGAIALGSQLGRRQWLQAGPTAARTVATTAYAAKTGVQPFAACADPANTGGWVPRHELVRGDIVDDYGTRSDEGVATDLQATENRRIRPDRRVPSDHCLQQVGLSLPGLRAGSQVVREHAIGSKEDVILDGHPPPYQDGVLYRHVGSERGPGLNEGMITDVASGTDPCPLHDMREGPDPGIWTDLGAFAETVGMDENRVIWVHAQSSSGIWRRRAYQPDPVFEAR